MTRTQGGTPPTCNSSKRQEGSRWAVDAVVRATSEGVVENHVHRDRMGGFNQTRDQWDSPGRYTKETTATIRLCFVVVAVLTGRATLVVQVHGTVYMPHVHAMVIVSQTVGRYSAVRKCKCERRGDYAKCVQHGKNECRPRAQSFRQSPQHLQLFKNSIFGAAAV
jgi:hypothetical protein